MSKKTSTNTLAWHLRRMEAVFMALALIFLLLAIWWSGYRLQAGLTGGLFFLIGMFIGGSAIHAAKIERQLKDSKKEEA